jgi:hypothetical protein
LKSHFVFDVSVVRSLFVVFVAPFDVDDLKLPTFPFFIRENSRCVVVVIVVVRRLRRLAVFCLVVAVACGR